MTKQERNVEFLKGYQQLLEEEDAKLICALGLTAQGKVIAVLDLDNSSQEILSTIRKFVEGLEKMPTT